MEVVSEEPQPRSRRFQFPSTKFPNSSPEVAPEENSRDEKKNLGIFSESLAESWGRARREREMLRLVREYLQGTLVKLISKINSQPGNISPPAVLR